MTVSLVPVRCGTSVNLRLLLRGRGTSNVFRLMGKKIGVECLTYRFMVTWLPWSQITYFAQGREGGARRRTKKLTHTQVAYPLPQNIWCLVSRQTFMGQERGWLPWLARPPPTASVCDVVSSIVYCVVVTVGKMTWWTGINIVMWFPDWFTRMCDSGWDCTGVARATASLLYYKRSGSKISSDWLRQNRAVIGWNECVTQLRMSHLIFLNIRPLSWTFLNSI